MITLVPQPRLLDYHRLVQEEAEGHQGTDAKEGSINLSSKDKQVTLMMNFEEEVEIHQRLGRREGGPGKDQWCTQKHLT